MALWMGVPHCLLAKSPWRAYKRYDLFRPDGSARIRRHISVTTLFFDLHLPCNPTRSGTIDS